MKRAEIKTTVELFMERIGFERGTWLWQKGALLVVLGGQIRKFDFKSGISQKALSFQLGRLDTYAECFGIKEAWKANGMGKRLNGSNGWAGEVAGMPA